MLAGWILATDLKEATLPLRAQLESGTRLNTAPAKDIELAKQGPRPSPISNLKRWRSRNQPAANQADNRGEWLDLILGDYALVKNRWSALLGVADEMRVQASAQTSSSAK